MDMKFALVGLSALLLACPATAKAGDVDDLSTMLDEFLAHAGEAPAHQRFWAEDLVYTSSRGTRSDKAAIMASFEDADAAAERADGPVYRAEDVDIRLYGNTAIVAFRLVAASTGDDGTVTEQRYLNTGTFLRRNGVWQAVAWQATMIPETG